MAEQEFTEAGKVGQKLRSGLASAYKAAKGGAKWGRDYIKDFVTEYGDETLLNLYPQAVNLTAAAGEAIAGVANKPANLGRFPYYDLPTQFDETIAEPATSNAEVSQEEETPTITVSKPKRQPSEKLYRVMYAGKGAESSEVYGTKEEADAALKKSGGKGAVAGVNLSQETRGGEMLPVEDVQARKQRYMDQLSKTKEISKLESDRLKKIQALRNPQTEEEILTVAENKGRMSDALAAANEAKLAEDKKEGREFASWASNVRAKRAVEGALNNYNSQLGLLKRAYSQARQSGNPLAAYKIQEDIQEYQAGVPKEMGARKKFAESGVLQEKMSMLKQKMEEARQQAEKDRRLGMVNSDYNR